MEVEPKPWTPPDLGELSREELESRLRTEEAANYWLSYGIAAWAAKVPGAAEDVDSPSLAPVPLRPAHPMEEHEIQVLLQELEIGTVRDIGQVRDCLTLTLPCERKVRIEAERLYLRRDDQLTP